MKALKEHRRLLAGIGLAALLLSCALIQWRQLDAMTLLRYLLLLAPGYCASLSDLRERLVPHVLMLLMLAAWVLWMGSFALVRWEEFLRLLLQSLAGGLVLGLAALVVYLLSRKGLGGGDVKFLAAAGLYLTVGPGLTAVILGTVLSAVTALVLMALRKLSVRDAIPLIPFLYAGILTVAFFA